MLGRGVTVKEKWFKASIARTKGRGFESHSGYGYEFIDSAKPWSEVKPVNRKCPHMTTRKGRRATSVSIMFERNNLHGYW